MKTSAVLLLMALFGASLFDTRGAQASDYDESFHIQPLATVSESDPSLSDLFSPNGKSQLCAVATLANIVAYQAIARTPAFPELQLQGTPGEADYTQQVRYFDQICHTDPTEGTTPLQVVSCMRQFYLDSGYPEGWAYIIGSAASTDPESVRVLGLAPLTIADIRHYLSRGVGLLMDVEWETENQISSYSSGYGSPYGSPMSNRSKWSPHGGHAFWVTGYDYNQAWGENQIDLDIVNPEGNLAETVVMSAEGDLPPGFTFEMTLIHDGGPHQGFVKNILAFLPDLSVEPALAPENL